MKTDLSFSAINVSTSGLRAQRKRMNIISENIANAETTKGENGQPYRRQIVTLQSSKHSSPAFHTAPLENDMVVPLVGASSGVSFGNGSMKNASFSETMYEVNANQSMDSSPFKKVYEPSHPDADEQGYVKMPNVNIVTEMVDMMTTSRGYEANVTAISAGKQMAKDALEM